MTNAKKKKKKKKMYKLDNCGGKKKGGCAFEWKVIDLASDVQCKKAA
jgi:hypothetical protein